MKIKIFFLSFIIFSTVFFCGQIANAGTSFNYCKCKDGTCKVENYDDTNPTALKNNQQECASCNGTMISGTKPNDCLAFIPPPAAPATPAPASKGAPQGEVKLVNPLGIGTDVITIIGTVINGIMGIMGALVLLMVVKGAGTWLTSSGNPEKVSSGAQTMLWAVLGAVITVSSYIILGGLMKLIVGN